VHRRRRPVLPAAYRPKAVGDAACPGLCVRITPKGVKSFAFAGEEGCRRAARQPAQSRRGRSSRSPSREPDLRADKGCPGRQEGGWCEAWQFTEHPSRGRAGSRSRHFVGCSGKGARRAWRDRQQPASRDGPASVGGLFRTARSGQGGSTCQNVEDRQGSGAPKHSADQTTCITGCVILSNPLRGRSDPVLIDPPRPSDPFHARSNTVALGLDHGRTYSSCD
jgi:hypothetical protein